MKEAIASWEPQARALMRFMAMYMILLHGLREVFGIVPARAKGPGSFMPLDPLGLNNETDSGDRLFCDAQ